MAPAVQHSDLVPLIACCPCDLRSGEGVQLNAPAVLIISHNPAAAARCVIGWLERGTAAEEAEAPSAAAPRTSRAEDAPSGNRPLHAAAFTLRLFLGDTSWFVILLCWVFSGSARENHSSRAVHDSRITIKSSLWRKKTSGRGSFSWVTRPGCSCVAFLRATFR